MQLHGAFLLVTLVAAGCLAEPTPPPRPAEGTPIVFGAPVSTGIPPQPFVEASTFEPFVIADARGRIFVSEGYSRFAASYDGGATFLPLPGPPPLAEAPVRRGGDVALGVDELDRLWSAKSLKTNGSEGLGIHVARSTDGGATWEPSKLLEFREADRPWLAFEAGTAHLLWYDVSDARDVYTANSTDGGASFSEPMRLDLSLGVGNVAAGTRGIVAADCRQVYTGAGGMRPWPSAIAAILSCEWRPMVASSPDGARVHVAFVDLEDRVCVATSMDGGATWDDVDLCEAIGPLVRSSGKEPEVWIIAGDDWTAVAAYAQSPSDGVDLHVLRLRDGTLSRGVAIAGLEGPADAPANTDFPALAALPDGRLVAAWAPEAGDIMVAVER